jgi:uncharacterized protein YbjT (DUF2867 family)
MVTGASGVVGDAVVRALIDRDEVRATVRRSDDAERVRGLGAKVAIRDIDAPGDLADILPRCHTLIHLIGGPNQIDDAGVLAANHGSTIVALAAAKEAGVRRFILVSVPGADPDAVHPYVRAKGLAEEAVAASGMEYAIVRATHVYGLGGLWFTAAVQGAIAEPPFAPGDGQQLIAPLFADDLAALVAHLDDRADAPPGTWGLEGPDTVAWDDLIRHLRGDGTPIEHAEGTAAARRLSDLLDIPVLESTATFFASPSRSVDATDASSAFGLVRTSMSEGLDRTFSRADVDHG